MNNTSTHRFSDDIKKFGRVLKIIKTFEPLFAMISVSAMLKMFRFSKVVAFFLTITDWLTNS